MAIKISVIIPCFNDGVYLIEAVECLKPHLDKASWEIIIVNDGSTDEATIKILWKLERHGITIIHQSNKGLGEARNVGLRSAQGKYIIPLDADNILVPEVFEEAAKLFESNHELAAVYTNHIRFGIENAEVWPGEIDRKRILLGNYIDACAIFRKETLMEVGGYDSTMPYMGCEDWDLWLRLIFHNKQIDYLRKIGFKYRVRNDSMVFREAGPNYYVLRNYIINKLSKTSGQEIIKLLVEIADERGNHVNRLLSKFDFYNGYFKKNKLKSIVRILMGGNILK